MGGEADEIGAPGDALAGKKAELEKSMLEVSVAQGDAGAAMLLPMTVRGLTPLGQARQGYCVPTQPGGAGQEGHP